MNLQNILNEIEKADPEVFEKISPRRSVIRNWGKTIALTAIPFALGSMFKKAYGQVNSTIIDTLNFALTLEYLEAEFYNTALSATTLNIPTDAARGAITTISTHENQHVAFLRKVISDAGSTPVTKPTFDLSGGNGTGTGPFAQAFSDYDLFLAVAQTLEDTGVRAYKGQAGNLMENNTYLTAALNIHSVEARHASHIRQMRRARGGAAANNKPWITGKDTGGIPENLVGPNYAGEDATTQAGVNIAGFVSVNAATEAFDEILTKEAVLAIVDPFIV
ncbi:MAG: ferritin-like domain-containing protein [Sphingobacteriales bacterium]|nr:MAG: ferritin-like domain-containing protein [Sphingobacteriales bacterium]